jgi:putative FmdB family regulatory protein
MPTYEYFCETCQKEFETIITLHEHDEGKIVCPKCGSEKVHQMLRSVERSLGFNAAALVRFANAAEVAPESAHHSLHWPFRWPECPTQREESSSLVAR